MEMRIKIGAAADLIQYASIARADSYKSLDKVIGFAVNFEFFSQISSTLRYAIKSNANMMFGLPVEIFSSCTNDAVIIVFIDEPDHEFNVRETISAWITTMKIAI